MRKYFPKHFSAINIVASVVVNVCRTLHRDLCMLHICLLQIASQTQILCFNYSCLEDATDVQDDLQGDIDVVDYVCVDTTTSVSNNEPTTPTKASGVDLSDPKQLTELTR